MLLDMRRGFRRAEGEAMTDRSRITKCAYCGRPFPVVDGHIQQWRVGEEFACNEFCAEGVEDRLPKRRAS
jgi:hypothetical protein